MVHTCPHQHTNSQQYNCYIKQVSALVYLLYKVTNYRTCPPLGYTFSSQRPSILTAQSHQLQHMSPIRMLMLKSAPQYTYCKKSLYRGFSQRVPAHHIEVIIYIGIIQLLFIQELFRTLNNECLRITQKLLFIQELFTQETRLFKTRVLRITENLLFR